MNWLWVFFDLWDQHLLIIGKQAVKPRREPWWLPSSSFTRLAFACPIASLTECRARSKVAVLARAVASRTKAIALFLTLATASSKETSENPAPNRHSESFLSSEQPGL
jgi:hypothetical protein